MSILEVNDNVSTIVPTIKPKTPFEEAVEKLDLKGTLMLLTFLSQRALELSLLEKQPKPKSKTILHA